MTAGSVDCDVPAYPVPHHVRGSEWFTVWTNIATSSGSFATGSVHTAATGAAAAKPQGPPAAGGAAARLCTQAAAACCRPRPGATRCHVRNLMDTWIIGSQKSL
jgi:hypothetical protein